MFWKCGKRWTLIIRHLEWHYQNPTISVITYTIRASLASYNAHPKRHSLMLINSSQNWCYHYLSIYIFPTCCLVGGAVRGSDWLWGQAQNFLVRLHLQFWSWPLECCKNPLRFTPTLCCYGMFLHGFQLEFFQVFQWLTNSWTHI